MSGMDEAPETPPAETAPPQRERLPSPPEHDPLIVEDGAALEAFAEHVATCPLVAIDTEANSMFAYRESTCIMQVTAGERSAIIDVLAVEDLTPMRAAVDRADVEIVFHGGDYDITVLTRDHDFRFDRVFDTMIAATLLGDEKVGLAALVEDHFGHTLDKRFQRADWAKRPLTDEQLDYLRRDTMYLPALRAHYTERLVDADLEEEAAIEFRRLAGRQGTPAAFDEDGWRRIKGARKLDARGRAVLKELYLWREKRAEKRDVPTFKVLSPRIMVDMAAGVKRPPRSPHELQGLSDGLRRRFGRDFLRLVRTGLNAAEEGRAPDAHDGPRPSPEEVRAGKIQRKREDILKDWRRGEARKREVVNAVVLPNPAVAWLARERPTDVADLAACPDIGPKRTARYGATWVKLLAKT